MDWCRKVDEAIIKTVKEFRENPYVFIYESDIQARLYYLISRGINNRDWYIKTLIGYGVNTEWTTPIHTQTAIDPNDTENQNRCHYIKNHLDIGIWDIKHPDFNNKDYREKPLLIGIEIKYHWSQYFRGISKNHKTISQYLADLDKLLNFKRENKNFIGYALWFLPKMDYNFFQRTEIIQFIKNKINDVSKIYSYVILKDRWLFCDRKEERWS